MSEKFLRADHAAEKCGFSKSMLWAKVNPNNRRYDAEFPRPVRLSARAVAWLDSELDEWISRRAAHHRYKRDGE